MRSVTSGFWLLSVRSTNSSTAIRGGPFAGSVVAKAKGAMTATRAAKTTTIAFRFKSVPNGTSFFSGVDSRKIEEGPLCQSHRS